MKHSLFGQIPAVAGMGIVLCCATASRGGGSLTVVPGRIPYMAESVGHVVVTTIHDQPGSNLTLAVSTPAGDVLGTGPVVPGQRSAVQIPLAGVSEGTNQLHCRLLSSGTEVSATDVTLTKLPPKPHAVQIDNRRRGLVVDGLPFFPFGFFSTSNKGDAGIPPDLAEQGFNLYSPYSASQAARGEQSPESLRTWMDRCAQVGVKVNYHLCPIYEYWEGSWGDKMTPEKKQALRTQVEAFRDHPALLSWYLADEPKDAAIEGLNAMRQFVKELDPYHPVTMVWFEGPGMPQRPEWRDVTDVAWLDIYPVLSPASEQQSPVAATVANWLGRLDRLFGYSLPLWYSPQFFGGWGSQQREPSAHELRAMTYSGLISGTTAIQYWPYDPGIFPASPDLWAEAGRLARETMELTTFLLSEEPRRQVSASKPGVLAAGWQDRGMVLVMGLNVENAPTSFKVTLTDSNYSGPADVLFENRQVEVRAGVIEGTIEAQGTRVYQIPEGLPSTNLAELHPGNLRLNPSFEDWVNAGSPTGALIKRGAGCACFLDARTSVHGRHSLRMTATGTDSTWGIRLLDNVAAYGVSVTSLPAKIQAGQGYRVSIWAKADRPGLPLRLALPGTDHPPSTRAWVDTHEKGNFTLTTDWREYSFLAIADEASMQAGRLEIVGSTAMSRPKLDFTGPGVAWVDLLQVIPAE